MSGRIDEILQAAVDAGDVPCVVAMAADDSGLVYEGAAGPRSTDGGEPVTPDTMFRIASMTKMVCTVAALQLRDRRALDFHAPIERYRPEFGDVQLLEGFDGDTPRLRAPASKATVAQLVTHTTGLGYWFWSEETRRWHEVTGTPNVISGSNAVFAQPLVAEPGTRYVYGINTDWLGKVVETASGQALDAYFREHITGPLGMANTTFLMSPEQRANSVPVHLRDDRGAWQPSDLDWSQEPDWWAAGHGLYSTPRDYLAFQRMLLGGGSLGDVKILDAATVEEAFRNQIGDLDFPAHITTADPASTADFHAGPSHKWGHGLLLNTDRQPRRRSAGSGAWAGIFNTHFWVDPVERITGAIYSQTLPFVEPRVFQVYTDFEEALYATRQAGRFERSSATESVT